MWAGIVQLIRRLATSWTTWGINPGGCKIFRTHPKGLGDTGSFTRVKRPEYDNHPHPSNAKVYETVELYIYSTSGTSRQDIG